MINISTTRGKYIFKPTVPSSTATIDYQVTVGGVVGGSSVTPSVVFVGKTNYFGGTYEVDFSDWIDSFLSKYLDIYTQVSSVSVSIVFTYTSEGGTTSTQTMTYAWTPDDCGLPVPSWDACGGAALTLVNSGFVNSGTTSKLLTLKLYTWGYTLVGKTINNIEKTNYMDKYGDKHNGSCTNKFEFECYIDPDWLKVGEDGTVYNKVMTACQSSKRTLLRGVNFLTIKGFGSGGSIELEGRVKDVEKVDVYSTYNVNQKVPTLKITFEVYR